ncbi:MAG: hypothetical protein AB7Q17_11040 [Phycisphaerae bacterium]
MTAKDPKPRCPVCDWELTDAVVRVRIAGREVAVCCEECAAKLKAKPAPPPAGR